MRESEIEYVVPHINFDEVIERIHQNFGLKLFKKGMTHVRDMYMDTESFHLCRASCSFRVRLKLEDIYRGAQLRLTFKSPIREHPFMLIREEMKLTLLASEFGVVSDFFGTASAALVREKLYFRLIVEETSTEALMGEPGGALNVSFDRVKFIDPANQERIFTENFFEIEDHGIGEEMLTEVGKKLEEVYNILPCTETKYRRGLRLLAIYEG